MGGKVKACGGSVVVVDVVVVVGTVAMGVLDELEWSSLLFMKSVLLFFTLLGSLATVSSMAASWGSSWVSSDAATVSADSSPTPSLKSVDTAVFVFPDLMRVVQTLGLLADGSWFSPEPRHAMGRGFRSFSGGGSYPCW